MTEASKQRMEELRSAYRYGVWPDADKDKASTRDADLACLGFEAGFDACDEEIVQKLQSELKAKDEVLRECEKAIRHMHYCKYWLNKSHEDCDCNMHLIVEKLREGKK